VRGCEGSFLLWTVSGHKGDTMSAHTKGPWQHDGYGDAGSYTDHWGIFTGDGHKQIAVCRLPGKNETAWAGEAQANARLIASAPDLLNTLKEIQEYLSAADFVQVRGSQDSRGNRGQKVYDADFLALKAVKAIAQAEGDQL